MNDDIPRDDPRPDQPGAICVEWSEIPQEIQKIMSPSVPDRYWRYELADQAPPCDSHICYTCDKIFVQTEPPEFCEQENHDVEFHPAIKPAPASVVRLVESVAGPAGPAELDVFENIDPDGQRWQAYFEKIRSGEWHGMDLVPGLALPGMGTSRRSCGNWIVKGCIGPQSDFSDANKKQTAAHAEAGHGVIERHILSCHGIGCPTCFEIGINRAAGKAAERLEAFLMLLDSDIFQIHKKRIFNHFVVAVNPAERELMKSADYRRKFENRMRRHLKSLGIEGGLMIFHPYAFTTGLETPYFRPHYHFLLTGYTDPEKIKKMHEKTGHVFRSIRTFHRGADLFGVIRYLLSHAGITTGTHTIRYFGQAQNRFFSTKSVQINSSEFADDISEIMTDVETGDSFVSKKFDRKKLVSVDAQFFHHEKEYDLESYTKGKVKSPSTHDIMTGLKKYKDNAPIPKSALDFIVMRLVYECQEMCSIEKCQQKKYFVIRIDPSEHQLCPICLRRIRHILPTNQKKPELEWDSGIQGVDIPAWEYYDFHIHGQEGFPYWSDEYETMQKDIGERIKNIFFEKQPKWSQNDQMTEIERSMRTVFRHEFLNGNTSPAWNELPGYIDSRIEDWRRMELGQNLPLDRDEKTVFDIAGGRQKTLQV